MISFKRMFFEENYAALCAQAEDENLKKTLKLEMRIIDLVQIPLMLVSLWIAIKLVIFLFSFF